MNCSICLGPCKVTSAHRVGHIRQALSHECDGPITPFVLICRAMEVAYNEGLGNAEDCRVHPVPDNVANALHEELSARGWIVPDEDAGIIEVDS